MTIQRKIWFPVTGICLLLSFAAGILELCGVSVCFFGTPLNQYLAIPICLFSVAFCVLMCRRHWEHDLQSKLLRGVFIVLCAVTVCITVFASLFTATHYVGQSISPNKEYKIFYEEQGETGEPIAHLYRRYSPFFMTYRNSAVLYDFAQPTVDAVETAWGDSYCTVSYFGYAMDAKTADELQPLERKLYYEPTA